jgi:hypothetical protein
VLGMRVSLVACVWIKVAQLAGAVAHGSGVCAKPAIGKASIARAASRAFM